jgi:nucleotide-binding universal stress UspA family protein
MLIANSNRRVYEMKILIPVETVSDAKLILDFVANYHFPPKTKINIFHAIDLSNHTAQDGEISVQVFLNQLKKKLQLFVKVADVTTTILYDHPVNAIAHLVEKWKADMVIMGYSTRSHNDGNLAAGSVSRAIAAQVPCSVVIIRPPLYQASLVDEEDLEPVFSG